MGYILFKELLLPGGSYPVIDQTVLHLSENAKVTQLLGGPPLSLHGISDGRRRRPAVHQGLLEDGRRVIDAAFFVRGSKDEARVTLQAVEREDGEWEERYLALDIPGLPTQILVQPVVKSAPRQGWHPFASWFK